MMPVVPHCHGTVVVAARIEGDVDPFRVDVLEVLHLVGTGLEQEALIDPDRHEARGGHDDVEAMAAGADLGERGVVRVIVGDGDLDLVRLLELLDEFGVGVVAPVEDLQFAVGKGGCRPSRACSRRRRRLSISTS